MNNRKKIRPIQKQQMFLERTTKKAIELYGLRFDNRLDELLRTGLKANTLTYLYGKRVSGILNMMALNSVRQFGGRPLFVDAGNSADPYLIRREADLRKKDSAATKKLQKISRAWMLSLLQIGEAWFSFLSRVFTRKSASMILLRCIPA